MKLKRSLAWLVLALISCSLFSLTVLGQDVRPPQTKHEPITQHLITMVEHNAELRKLLVKSIQQAKETNPDSATNPAQTLEDYYGFVDWATKAMPWSVNQRRKLTREQRAILTRL